MIQNCLNNCVNVSNSVSEIGLRYFGCFQEFVGLSFKHLSSCYSTFLRFFHSRFCERLFSSLGTYLMLYGCGLRLCLYSSWHFFFMMWALTLHNIKKYVRLINYSNFFKLKFSTIKQQRLLRAQRKMECILSYTSKISKNENGYWIS